MKNVCNDNTNIETATLKVDDAVGVPESEWFVAIVNNNSEGIIMKEQ